MPFFEASHIRQRDIFKDFIAKEVVPYAQEFDSQQAIPRSFFQTLARAGYLGACIPKRFGGQEMDYITLGLMHEEFGKALCSIENALTVYGMVCKPLIKFGTEHQRQAWLPKIAAGEVIVALALTEPHVGSDLREVETRVEEKDNKLILTGRKRYITLGQIADLFLVLAKYKDEHIALLIPKNTPALHVSPITDLLGLRSNMLAEIHFNECFIEESNILGKAGMGMTHIISTALDEGRYTTAWGCVGLGQACLAVVREYSRSRKQFGVTLNEHQLIQKMMTEIIVTVKASREICFNAANLRDQGDVAYISETLVAKYFASKMATLVSHHAIQILGAAGFTKEYPVERFYRDAKAMELIEGTSQMYEINIPKICLD